MSHLQPIPNDGNDSGSSLAARLRPEFSRPVILVDPDDPVMGGPQCLVAVCERLAVIFGKCSAHHRRWIDDGRPDDVEAWATGDCLRDPMPGRRAPHDHQAALDPAAVAGVAGRRCRLVAGPQPRILDGLSRILQPAGLYRATVPVGRDRLPA